MLINITGSTKMSMDEISEASTFIKNEVHASAEIIWGMVFDETMGDEIRITVIATGIGDKKERKIINLRGIDSEDVNEDWNSIVKEDLDKPTFQRRLANSDKYQQSHDLNPAKKGIFHRVFQKEDLDYPTFLRKQAD